MLHNVLFGRSGAGDSGVVGDAVVDWSLLELMTLLLIMMVQ